MKFPRRSDADELERARLASELGVDKVYYVDIPLWYTRLAGPVAKKWQRELAFLVAVFVVGLGLGFVVGRA